MITSQQAIEIILNQSQDVGIEEIPFLDSLGRVLKENIVADRDFPPFDRVSMDGIAINFDVFDKGKTNFPIENIQAAGAEQLVLNNNQHCIEVMTGAVLPRNTDSVIPYELVTIKDGQATVITESVLQGQNIHKKGLDRKQNDVLLGKNTIISAAEIGVLATVGKTNVKVAKQPKVMIISTGDELVEVDQNPLNYQIRKSNVYTLVALLQELKINAKTAHINDDRAILKQKIEGFLEEYDVLLFSGAVSKGKYDFLPEILEELGVKKLFHKVKQRPGKPFWFGEAIGSFGMRDSGGKNEVKNNSTTVFAFPGNPVSTFAGCLKYFYPWYQKSMGIPYENLDKAILSEDFTFKPELTYFLQVSLKNENGKLIATPKKGKGSGDLANLADADGFLELPADRTDFKKGEVFPLIKYR
ncbi:molybdopterin molybdotransferase MoeA [Aureibaculum sp. 2210JD6-5]|uniref:molybdopterin molybdotransferase MoeA n=1 Tax=Aureibaculum sp. 2210JD6-5 TaxID=3103957 RepID=UPI002AAD704E|nr:molybdopterin molybdotransferase MoeA [Aureibaculum sp. 2210JD6-5]MDY7396208.1 molybdopterin molybdotransferase MoeA [Aureibaculum sp. 2210JD6-5]